MTRAAPGATSFARKLQTFLGALDGVSGRSVLMFGGKGGVGKTTIASLSALHLAPARPVVLFTTDPASNLRDLLGSERVEGLTVEQLDAESLYGKFLSRNLEPMLELGDRGTYLDRDELRRFFELSLPGIDELMGWMRITELADENPDSIVVVDTAPTGHTLRLLSSGLHFRQVGEALESMQAKHRELVEQLTRRRLRDAIDAFLDDFRGRQEKGRALFADSAKTAFVPVFLAEPWVVSQTGRLIRAVRDEGIDVPFAVLNQAATGCACPLCAARRAEGARAFELLAPTRVVEAPRACRPLHGLTPLRAWLDGKADADPPEQRTATTFGPLRIPPDARILFFAGKGGVGKTTTASSTALQLAGANPEKKFTLISVDPAHGIVDAFAAEAPPPNLAVETVDTRGRWEEVRGAIGREIERAVDAVTPSGMSIAHDEQVMKQLMDVGPPGADEIFALMRLHQLLSRDDQELILVDTAPTGHFLRLLDLPGTAGEWVREFMRIILHYRELIPPGRLGEELLDASRALHRFTETIQSPRAAAVVVTRADPVVLAETGRLVTALEAAKLRLAGIVVNAVTPETECECDRRVRAWEIGAAAGLPPPLTMVERRNPPLVSLDDLRKLIPIAQTERP